MRGRWIALALLGSAAGCNRAEPAAAPASTDDGWVPDDAPLRALIDLPARRAALQGTWLVPLDPGPSIEPWPFAVTIAGDAVTTWDGRAEEQARLDTDVPCELALMQPSPGGTGEQGDSYAYRVHDGVAEVGKGSIGERLGGGAMVCNGVYVYFSLDDGHCVRRSVSWFMVGSLPASDGIERASCGFRRDGDREVFFIAEPANAVFPAREEILPVDGWRIGSFAADRPGRPPPLPHTRVAPATARAFVDADARANDPLLIAQAAGGVIGDTTTVPGLVATYASTADELLDTTVRVRAVVVRAPSRRANSDLTLFLADPDHRDRPRVRCYPPLEALADGARVTVAGRVCGGNEDWTERHGEVPGLCDCVVVGDGGAP